MHVLFWKNKLNWTLLYDKVTYLRTKKKFIIKILQIDKTMCAKKEWSMLLRFRAKLHKTQGQILAIDTFWQVNMARLINLLWLLLQKDYLGEFPSV